MVLILIIGVSDLVRFAPIWSDLVIRVTRKIWHFDAERFNILHVDYKTHIIHGQDSRR